MQRRGRSEQPVKGRRHKAIRPKARKASTAQESTDPSAEQFDRLKRERDEALEQQAATSEVLQVISQSAFDLKSVLQALVESAARLCKADKAAITRQIGGEFFFTETYGLSPEFIDHVRTVPVKPERGTVSGLALLEGRTIHVSDVRIPRDEIWAKAQRLGNFRTILGVPMLREGTPIGVLGLVRTEAQPFTDKQIELVQNFAAQAVIAIENTRLLNELRQRTDDLSEALEQQTATSEVLKVISSSPGELEPVFKEMLEKATQICGASFGTLLLFEGNAFRRVAAHNAPHEYVQFADSEPLIRLDRARSLDRLAKTKEPVQIADMAEAEPNSPLTKLGGARTYFAVPMLKENELIGAIGIYRQEVRPFTEKQIELVENFAAQAVIAIENTRLLNELRQRTDDLTESLEQQTATSEVLKIISSSPGELAPVFDVMLESAVRLCEAKFGNLFLYNGEAFRAAALHRASPAYAEARRRDVMVRDLHPDVPLARVSRTKETVHIADVKTTRCYIERDPFFAPLVEAAGARTLLVVPMRKEGELIGAIAIYRQEVNPFSDKQVELVTNFAAQAVIAIENTRLLNELRESLQQQTATADVLKVISSSPGELKPVFQAMLEKAVHICGAKFGILFLTEGDAFRTVALHGAPPAYAEARRREPVTRIRPGTALGRASTVKRPVQIADVRAEPAYRDLLRADFLNLSGARTVVAVPMLKEDELVGAILIYRQEVQPFTEKQIELLENFAAQAVIAIENTRLLNELRESLQQQTATSDVLKVISRSTFDLGTVLQTLVESAARLCDADKTNISRQKDGVFFRAESYGFSAEFMDYVRNIPIQPDRGSAFGRALLERRAVHIPDVKADPEYTLVEGQKLGDYRTVLAVPMLREGVAIGVLSLTRSEMRPFSEKQIELATTFADQAAIAIENVRLFESVEARTRELAKSLDDLRATQDRLVQTQKLASLGQLTAGIAHEIKNPLNFVNNFSGVSAELLDELKDALKDVSLNERRRSEITELMDTLRGNLDKVVQHGKRADSIVKNMLLHSREGSGEHRVVDINAIVEESLNLAYHGARAEKQGFCITVERSLDPTAGEADIFPQEITRALLNLISNSFYAATKRHAETNGSDHEPTVAAATKNLGDSVEIRIRDNGTGIPPEVKEKIFNPFFTTKPAGEGTGLGLSISHDIIVKQHGGSIEVDTQPGEFTEIRIILPRAAVLVAERA